MVAIYQLATLGMSLDVVDEFEEWSEMVTVNQEQLERVTERYA